MPRDSSLDTHLNRLGRFKFFAAILAAELVLFAGLVIFGGIVLQWPAELPDQSDLVVVLGGSSMSARLQKGAELYKKQMASRILITGFSEESLAIVELQADWRFRYLRRVGVPSTAILTDGRAKSSAEEASVIADLMRANNWKKLLIVSDPPHLLRLALIMKRTFQSSDFDHRLISSSPPWWNAKAWWANSQSASFVIEEYIKIGYFLCCV